MKRNNGMLFVVLGLGLLYAVWLLLSGPGIPCPFRKVTGWLCPGCGITTLILCLLKLDFTGAFAANPFLFVTGPFLAAGFLYIEWKKQKGKPQGKWIELLFFIYGIFLCIFGILRNFC